MSYDDWKCTAPEMDVWEGDCPVCDGGEGSPCSEECELLVIKAKRAERIAGWEEQISRASRLAKTYLAEDGPGGRREADCIREIEDCIVRIDMARACAVLDNERRSA